MSLTTKLKTEYLYEPLNKVKLQNLCLYCKHVVCNLLRPIRAEQKYTNKISGFLGITTKIIF